MMRRMKECSCCCCCGKHAREESAVELSEQDILVTTNYEDNFVGYEMPTQAIATKPTHVIVNDEESHAYEILRKPLERALVYCVF